MLEVWDAWLQVPEAKQDPGYEAIKGVVRKFVPPPTEETLPASNSKKQNKRRKKRKNAKTHSAAKKTGSK
ncbi:unnamed protein product [Phytophthora fragariaefolia]|uniref:Unnamed protein product n=1 Tax=Phytophthora fragariaefolia TaxID=1490495 RepID=A0A9W7D4U7_9STRA|nr:unnamed protein product [Phytophthora fragariaefolia]